MSVWMTYKKSMCVIFSALGHVTIAFVTQHLCDRNGLYINNTVMERMKNQKGPDKIEFWKRKSLMGGGYERQGI